MPALPNPHPAIPREEGAHGWKKQQHRWPGTLGKVPTFQICWSKLTCGISLPIGAGRYTREAPFLKMCGCGGGPGYPTHKERPKADLGMSTVVSIYVNHFFCIYNHTDGLADTCTLGEFWDMSATDSRFDSEGHLAGMYSCLNYSWIT